MVNNLTQTGHQFDKDTRRGGDVDKLSEGLACLLAFPATKKNTCICFLFDAPHGGGPVRYGKKSARGAYNFYKAIYCLVL